MADTERYIIDINGQSIKVPQEVYHAYYHMERQERWQEEKKQEHGVFSYDALDNGETVGEETFPDLASPSLEEQAIAKDIHLKLHRAMAALTSAERELIYAIYFEGLTEREYAQKKGSSQMGINKRRRKILSKMRIFMDFMGSF